MPGDDGRALVLEQTGRVWMLDGDELLPDPFLDLTDRVVDLDRSYDERGLLGLAFHPDFASNGRLFVYYSAPLRDARGIGPGPHQSAERVPRQPW